MVRIGKAGKQTKRQDAKNKQQTNDKQTTNNKQQQTTNNKHQTKQQDATESQWKEGAASNLETFGDLEKTNLNFCFVFVSQLWERGEVGNKSQV